VSWGAIWNDEVFRLRLLAVAILLALGGLAARLWWMQVTNAKLFQHNLSEQSIRRVYVPGARGQIRARDGAVLALNQPSYNLVLYLEELRRPGRWQNTVTNVEATVQKLAQLLEQPPQLKRSDILAHIHKRLPLPLTAWRNLTAIGRARLAEQTLGMRGVAVEVEPARVYPEGPLAAHVLGYTRRVEPELGEDETFNYLEPEMKGAAGIEKRYDHALRGAPGEKIIAVDVSGYNYRFALPGLAGKLGQREPVSGRDVLLTLEPRIQRLAEHALEGVSGAVVVLDPNNGDVLALASKPGFDPNELTGVVSAQTWQALNLNPDKPLFNRALSGAFAPGSIFKPVVAMAALDLGRASPNTTYTCPGHYLLGKARFNCWENLAGHGAQDLHGALMYSCNVYFFNLGLHCGPEVIHERSLEMGLGARTGIDLDGEVAGLIPDDAWKRRERKSEGGWRDGDTCNMAIGQGAVLVTPLQMANVTAALANGGKVWQPHLVLGLRDELGVWQRTPPKLARVVPWNPAHLKLVRESMRDVINAPTGTGRHAKVPGVIVAGKTGTAEVGRKGEGHKNTWMIAFAPYDAPRYAVAMLVEEGVSGGATVAPLLQKLLNGIFHPDTGEGEG
jgi:penicillin-binding protein 2